MGWGRHGESLRPAASQGTEREKSCVEGTEMTLSSKRQRKATYKDVLRGCCYDLMAGVVNKGSW